MTVQGGLGGALTLVCRSYIEPVAIIAAPAHGNRLTRNGHGHEFWITNFLRALIMPETLLHYQPIQKDQKTMHSQNQKKWKEERITMITVIVLFPFVLALLTYYTPSRKKSWGIA